MKTTIQILTCKLITNVCKLFKKNGTVYPGSVALKMNGKVLESIKYPKYVIGVTGSSGKGSTTSMLAHILKDNGLNVVWNSSGSNVLNGTATLILNNTNAHKIPDANIAAPVIPIFKYLFISSSFTCYALPSFRCFA